MAVLGRDAIAEQQKIGMGAANLHQGPCGAGVAARLTVSRPRPRTQRTNEDDESLQWP
jgi:hypothetical protein